MEALPLFVGFSSAIGIGLLTYAVLSVFYDLGRRLKRAFNYHRSYLGVLGLNESKENPHGFNEEVTLGLPRLPWNTFYALAALLGLVLFLTISPYLNGFGLVFLTLPGWVWLFRRYLIHQRKRFMVAQIRQLLIDIRLHTSLCGSLLLGLENISNNTGESSGVYQALKRQMSGGSAKSGLDVLEQLAHDLKSEHLLHVSQRVRSAQQSGGLMGLDQAITNSIEELSDEISGQVEEQMQQMPTRVTLLAMPFLLGPIVILIFYPLVDRILKTLSGAAVGGGF